MQVPRRTSFLKALSQCPSPNITVSCNVCIPVLLKKLPTLHRLWFAKKDRYFHLSGSLKKIGKYIGRGKKRSIAGAVADNNSLLSEVVSSLCSEAHKEIKRFCSDIHDSNLCMTTKPALEQFTWDRVWHEIQLKCTTHGLNPHQSLSTIKEGG